VAVATTGLQDVHSSGQITTTSISALSFYRLDALLAAEPTVSKHCRHIKEIKRKLKENIEKKK